MKFIALALALIAGTACGKNAKLRTDGMIASCVSDEFKTCREYHGDSFTLGDKGLRDMCTLVDKRAKFALTPCPTANIAARCTLTDHVDLYYAGSEVISTAEQYCHGAYAAK